MQGKNMSEHSWGSNFPGSAASAIGSPASTVVVTPVPKDRGWIESPAYDLALLVLSPAAGLLFALLNQTTHLGHVAGVLVLYFIGIPHYLSTFTFYLGDQNRDHYRLRWAAFFLGPLIIFCSVLGLQAMGVEGVGVVAAVIFTWNIYHVSFQSAGILSLYRRLNGGDQKEKGWANLTILSVNAAMSFWFVSYFPPLNHLLVLVHPLVPMVLRYACLAMALLAGIGYVSQLLRRPGPFRAPERVFLISSLLLFHPYLWMRDYHAAAVTTLSGHFIQYLGILWLLNRRKYREQVGGSTVQQWLIKISSRPQLLLISLMILGAFFLSLDRGSRFVGLYVGYNIVWSSLVLIHFYVDGLVWAFKDSFVRKTVGPYLALESHRV
jgi:hypothetical protein